MKPRSLEMDESHSDSPEERGARKPVQQAEVQKEEADKKFSKPLALNLSFDVGHNAGQ